MPSVPGLIFAISTLPVSQARSMVSVSFQACKCGTPQVERELMVLVLLTFSYVREMRNYRDSTLLARSLSKRFKRETFKSSW